MTADKKRRQFLHEGLKKTLLHNFSRIEEEYLSDRSIFVAYDHKGKITMFIILRDHMDTLSDIYEAVGQTLFYASFMGNNIHLGLLDEAWKIIPDSLKRFLNNHINLAIFNPSNRKLVVLKQRKRPRDLKSVIKKV
ncbi:MAG: hypothetical protein ACFFCD_14995 [Promethearchaeota archaeon]